MVIYTKEWELFGVIHLHRSQSCFLSLSLSVDEFTCANKGCWKRRFSLSVSLFYALILSFNPSLPFLISQYLSKVATVSSSTRFTRPGASPSLSLTPVWPPSDSHLTPVSRPHCTHTSAPITVTYWCAMLIELHLTTKWPPRPPSPQLIHSVWYPLSEINQLIHTRLLFVQLVQPDMTSFGLPQSAVALPLYCFVFSASATTGSSPSLANYCNRIEECGMQWICLPPKTW